MKTLFKTIFAAVAAAGAAASMAAPPNFTTDLDAAIAKAKARDKIVLACFSGSDWCIWCKRLDGEVLSRPEFAQATNDFELAFIDITMDPPATEKNLALMKQYKVRGFPTVLLLDGDGRTLESTGYRKGGPKAYLEHLSALKAGIRARSAERGKENPPQSASGESGVAK